MNCPSCGTPLGPADRFCPACGAPVNAQPEAGRFQADPARPRTPLPDPTLSVDRQNVSKSLYCSNLASDKVRKGITSSAIICYICAALTGMMGLIAFQTFFVLIDPLVLLVLGILIQVRQSRAAAVVLLVYSLINCVYALIANGTLGGWLIIIAAVYGVKCTFALDREYKEYQGW